MYYSCSGLVFELVRAARRMLSRRFVTDTAIQLRAAGLPTVRAPVQLYRYYYYIPR